MTATTRAQDALDNLQESVRAQTGKPNPTSSLSVDDCRRLGVVLNYVPSIVDYRGFSQRAFRAYEGDTKITGQDVAVQVAVLGDAYSDLLNENEDLLRELRDLKNDIAAFRRILGTSQPDEL